MEDWIKKNLEELEITPKSGNWAQISAELDDEKKKKQYVGVLLLSLVATVSIFIAFWYGHTERRTESSDTLVNQLAELKETNQVVSKDKDTSMLAKGDDKLLGNDAGGRTNEYLNQTVTRSKLDGSRITNEEGHTQALSKSEDNRRGLISVVPERVLEPEKVDLALVELQERQKNSPDSQTGGIKWVDSLEHKVPELDNSRYTMISPKVDSAAVVLYLDSFGSAALTKTPRDWKSLLIPDRWFGEYSRGVYLNNATSYLDITDNALNNAAIGVGYTISPRFEVNLGVGVYKGSVTSKVGDEIVISQKDVSSIGTSDPQEGLNNTIDTLTVINNTLYDYLRDKDVYVKGQTGTVTQSVSGFSIPISVNYKLLDINHFSVKSQLGMTFNLANKFSNLTYLDEFEVMVNSQEENNGLVLRYYTFRGGLLTEYRPRNIGVFISGSLALNKSSNQTKSILTDSYQPSIGLGLNFYLNRK